MYNTDSHFFFSLVFFSFFQLYLFGRENNKKYNLKKNSIFLHLLASVFALFDGDEVVAVASTPTPEETDAFVES